MHIQLIKLLIKSLGCRFLCWIYWILNVCLIVWLESFCLILFFVYVYLKDMVGWRSEWKRQVTGLPLWFMAMTSVYWCKREWWSSMNSTTGLTKLGELSVTSSIFDQSCMLNERSVSPPWHYHWRWITSRHTHCSCRRWVARKSKTSHLLINLHLHGFV